MKKGLAQVEEQRKAAVLAQFSASLDLGLTKQAEAAGAEEEKEEEPLQPTADGILADFDASLDKGLARYKEALAKAPAGDDAAAKKRAAKKAKAKRQKENKRRKSQGGVE